VVEINSNDKKERKNKNLKHDLADLKELSKEGGNSISLSP
jgi:hypothetical protein